MITLDVQSRQPSQALAYSLVASVIAGLICLGLAAFLFSIGTIDNTSTVNGVTSGSTVSTTIPALILALIGVLFPLYTILYFNLFSFVVTAHNITINSGVLFRDSKAIDFDRLQNVDIKRGPLQMLFGISGVNLWTSSAGQINISTVVIGGMNRNVATPKPDGKLLLLKADAEDLRARIVAETSVQKVEVVVPPVAVQ